MNDLQETLISALFDSNESRRVKSDYVPTIISNDDHGTVLETLLRELQNCEEFYFSVAFLTEAGFQMLKLTLDELEEKGIKGHIIVSGYQYFTEPKALARMKEYKNITLKIVLEESLIMHTKGYIFKHEDNTYTTIVGSSNLTSGALKTNSEWNLKLVTFKDGSYAKKIFNEFKVINDAAVEVTDELIKQYKKHYNQTQILRKTIKFEQVSTEIKPNSMQKKALKALKELRLNGLKSSGKTTKGLLISATGTGKTYLAALDVKQFKKDKTKFKFLFIVHRTQIAERAMEAFKKILGDDIDAAVIADGNFKDADYLFANINTLRKERIYSRFGRDAFNYIVFDEAHRCGAEIYKPIFDYFEPEFMLGMTATPERSDGFDIYSLFDHNIAYEIRLQEAMKENLICPFHYYGICDLDIDDETHTSNVDLLTSDERVNHIIKNIRKYGYYGEKVKGLVFVSRNEEAKELSRKFNLKGYRTKALSGSDTTEERIEAVNRLNLDAANPDALDYVFTVDIFNEGVDIPWINQVVMLRPTESAIVFVQQLGRGLRKFEDKDFVIVIDFIGNYAHNFMIPIALFGDAGTKEKARRKVCEPNGVPGQSTVNFEKIAQKRIFDAIDKAKFSGLRELKKEYKQIKNKLGKIPSLKEFATSCSDDTINVDINRVIAAAKSYYNFLKQTDDEYDVTFDKIEEEYIQCISKEWLSGKKPTELEFLRILLDGISDPFTELRIRMQVKYPDLNRLTDQDLLCVKNQMLQKFTTGTRTKYQVKFIEEKNGRYEISDQFKGCLDFNKTFRDMVEETVNYGLELNQENYSNRYRGTPFNLYSTYSRNDVCRLLSWTETKTDQNIGGYAYDKDTNTMPIFINYVKDEEIGASIRYEDRFVNTEELVWISKNRRRLNSPEIQRIINLKNNNLSIDVFVRKNKDSNEFYYLGRVDSIKNYKEIIMADSELPAVAFRYELDEPIRQDIYDYITED